MEMEADVEGTEESPKEETVLYDLTIQAEWAQEPETLFRGPKERPKASFAGRITSAANRTAWTLLRSIGIPAKSGTPCLLPAGLVKLVSAQMNWQLAITQDGKQVAVLQDQTLEIRSSRDDFASPLGKWIVAKDSYQQWRQLAWSVEGDMVAYSTSTGKVEIFDVIGTPICSFLGDAQSLDAPVDLSHAVCSLIFKTTNIEKWDMELLVVNYQGTLKSYLIKEGDFQLHHRFTFSSHYPLGIGDVIYLPQHSLLFVGGGSDPYNDTESDKPTAMQYGITAWRLLSDYPHYKLITDYDQDIQAAKRSKYFMKKLKSIKWYGWSTEEKDGIYRLSLSPDGTKLAAIHYSGRFTLLDAPSLRIRNTWEENSQPAYDEVNQEMAQNPKIRKHFKEQLKAYNMTDCNWWSNEAVILARGTGAVTVSSAKTLSNLLGSSPEWFDPAPRLSMATEGGFLGLECELKFSSVKRHLDNEDEYEDSDEDQDVAMVTKTAKYVKAALYFVTDSERFQPPRKRPKIVNKTYRLVCLKSTTPEELYARKIDNEEYGEALALAQLYKLDCDLVFQRQWRKTPVSVASIHDYLSKISKRSWVLHECMERVPENIDAMRELLQYGLRGTDLEALVAVGKGTDEGKFILCDRIDAYEESLDTYDEETVEENKQAAQEKRQQFMEQVDFKKLNLYQIELCRARAKLLQFIDRLSTYEEILGGMHHAAERYDPAFFAKFRAQNIVEVATDYARGCDWRALDIIFTYHGMDTLPHRLPVLCNFPETYSPHEYKALLPEAGTDSEEEVLPWQEHSWREKDWVEADHVQAMIDPIPVDKGAFLYENDAQYSPFMGQQLDGNQLEGWYKLRVCEIEERSGQVDHALDLVNLGRERGINGLEELHDDLITLETLVYECQVDYGLTLQHLQETPDIDKLRLMMSRSSIEMYEKNVRRWLVPFLDRCELRKPGSFNDLIHEYLVSMAKNDLTLCLKIFQASRADQPNPVIKEETTTISFALECIYACQCCDQLSEAFGILECLPQRGFGVVSKLSSKLHSQVDQMEGHLSAAETLENNGMPLTITKIRDTQKNEKETKNLFTKLTRIAGRKTPPLTEKQWLSLLGDLLKMRDKAFQCVDELVCYEIFVESLLCSSSPANIQIAGKMMERSAMESKEPDYSRPGLDKPVPMVKVAYPRAVQLVLDAAREYFDSSSSLTDNCMDLARACLSLISDQPEEVVADLDLIEALALLDGFGVSILPIQVRMCKERLDLVQKAIAVKPLTYKNCNRLLRLGRLLRVGGDTDVERDGCVLQLIARAALQIKDYTVCYDTCQRLMEIGFPPVWQECMELAENENFSKISAKAELLAFAVTHCTAEMIEPILKAKSLLETQVLYERVHSQVCDRSSQSPGESPLSAKGAIQQTKEILSSTNKATKAVLSHVSDQKWWKKTLKSLQPLRSTSVIEEIDQNNDKFDKQGCHPFYKGLLEGAFKNRTETDYKNYRMPVKELGGLTFNESVMRTAKLEETITEGESANHSPEVLLQLAHDNMPLDLSLGIGYLLALPKPEEAEQCFQKLPSTAISLQAAVYYYALQLYSSLTSDVSEPNLRAQYLYPPAELTQRILSHVQWRRENNKEWPESVVPLVEKLLYYNELLIDYTQAQVLEELGRGVDVGRFTTDSNYKRETILGLAMSMEDSVYNIALSLAKRYELPVWEVYMAHLEFLFDSGELSTEEIESRLSQMAILPSLRQQGEEFVSRMAQYVYPSIAGTDHYRLSSYYSMLEGCTLQGNITPITHVKLLNRIKQTAPGLDYKKLTDGEHNPVDVIRPILTSDNIHSLAKLAGKIPLKMGGFIQPSVVFCGWAIQTFWDTTSGKRVPETPGEWIHRYEGCGEYLTKLLPEDVIHFIDGITFVPQAIEKLPVDCRRQLVRRALKYSRQQAGGGGGKKQKHVSETTGHATGWDEVIHHMQQSMEHIDKLNNPTLMAWKQSTDPQLSQYTRDFDLSRSEQEKVEKLLVQLVLDGQPPDTVEEIQRAFSLPGWDSKTVFKMSLTHLTQAIRGDDNIDKSLADKNCIDILRTVVQQVGKHEEAGGQLVHSEDVMILLRPFCADVTVSVQQRLEVLQILEQSFSLDDTDLVLLILYRTQAVVSTAWPDKKFDETAVYDQRCRLAVFEELLQSSTTLDQFLALVKLLNVWPSLDDNVFGATWSQLLVTMVTTCCSQDVGTHVTTVVESLQQSTPLPEKYLKELFVCLESSGLGVVGVQCLLTSDHSSLHEMAVAQLQADQQPVECEKLVQLILQHHLITSIVTTTYYSQVVEYVLANQSPRPEDTPQHIKVEALASQLQEAGLEAEAGSLMVQYRGLHPALRTFDAAVGLVSKWLFK